ncbi:MAG: alpha/beta hydrolase family esterase, partial [bacterium]
MIHTWRFLCIACALLFTASCAAASADPETRAAETIIDRPATAPGPLPTIIVLHGAGLSGALTRNMMALPKLAKEAGFVVAFPDAVGLVWNEASLARELPSAFYGPDDVALLDGLIDHLVKGGIADPAAIHLVGISNGGMMAAHYACQRAERLASLMLFKATMPPASDPPCTPARPLPVMLVAGTEDP